MPDENDAVAQPRRDRGRREPGAVQKVVRFGKAAARHLADGARHVDDATYQQRLEICRDCPECDLRRMVCCACSCRLRRKARWRTQTCPLEKWPVIETSKRNGKHTKTGVRTNPVIQ